MTSPEPDPAAELRRATLRYRRQKRRAAEIVRSASADFAATIRAAHDGGMKKSTIIKAIDNEWSRTWVDRACKGDGPDAEEEPKP
jgi:hypothetical protein